MQFERPSYPFRSGGKGFGTRLSQTPCHLLACGFGSAGTPLPKGHSSLCSARVLSSPEQTRGWGGMTGTGVRLVKPLSVSFITLRWRE